MTTEQILGFVGQLDALPDNKARAAQCRAWQREASAKWSQGQHESIQDMLRSADPRYRRMGPEMRKAIGKQKWSTSPTSKSLANDEMMFSRWAIMYGVAEP